MTPSALAVCLLLTGALSVFSTAVVQDCLASIVPDSEAGGTVVVDQGSTTSTNGSGCDDCKVVRVKIKVTWAYDSSFGNVTGLGTSISLGSIRAGQSDTYSWRADETVACGAQKDIFVSQPGPVEQPSGAAHLWFKCGKCE